MTSLEVKEIVIETLKEYGLSLKNLVAFKPEMKTREVVQYLGCDRHWLYDNKIMFGGRVNNRRGDYVFDTEKVVDYKMNSNLQ